MELLLNKGHIGIRSTIPCKEAVLISEVKIQWNLSIKDTMGSGLLSLVGRLSTSQRSIYFLIVFYSSYLL